MTDQNQTSTAIPADQYEKNKIMDQVALVSFVDDLIRDRKDPNVTDANMADIRATLLKKVNEEINIHMINCLTDKERIELDALLDKNPGDKELHEYFISKIPNLSVEIASVMLRFRAAYLLPLAQEQNQPENELSAISSGSFDSVQQAPSTETLNAKQNQINPLDDMRPAPVRPQEQSKPPENLPPAPVIGRRMN